jgi:hypothetical protein
MTTSIDSRLPIDGEFYLSHIRSGDEAALVEHLVEPEIARCSSIVAAALHFSSSSASTPSSLLSRALGVKSCGLTGMSIHSHTSLQRPLDAKLRLIQSRHPHQPTSSVIRIGEIYKNVARQENRSEDLGDSLWVDCRLEACELSGAILTGSIFTDCHFDNVVLYWCFAYKATFIGCSFKGCDLRGNFAEARFVKCRFENCEVGDNNLGGATRWENAQAEDCVVIGPPLPIVIVEEGDD